MPPGTSNDTTLENPAFLHALESWCKERETYPSRLEVNLPNTLSAGMPIFVAAKPQNNGDISYIESPRHVLIREKLTPSTVDRLATVLQGIGDQQGLAFRNGLCYMTQLYLVLYDLERMQASKTSMLSPHGYAQREEPQPSTLARFSRLWSLDDVLQFWERFDGQLNRGFMPPKDSRRGRWSYDMIPPRWFPYRGYGSVNHCWCLPTEYEEPSPPSVPIMVPAPWKEWVENLVALLQVPAQHGVHINISLGTAGAAVSEGQTEYIGGKNSFRQKGEVWDIVYQGHSFSLKHIKGLSYIAFLLRHPTEKFTPRQLSEGIGESVPAKGDRVYSSMSETRLEDQALGVSTWDGTTTDIEQTVDKQTVEQCRQKLADLTEQKEEAERYHDYERVTHLEAEIDAIIAYLTNNTHSGTIKTFPTSADKIRTSVTKRFSTGHFCKAFCNKHLRG
jgi:hypothetical protein